MDAKDLEAHAVEHALKKERRFLRRLRNLLAREALEFRVWCLNFEAWGSGFRARGLGFGVWGLGFGF